MQFTASPSVSDMQFKVSILQFFQNHKQSTNYTAGYLSEGPPVPLVVLETEEPNQQRHGWYPSFCIKLLKKKGKLDGCSRQCISTDAQNTSQQILLQAKKVRPRSKCGMPTMHGKGHCANESYNRKVCLDDEGPMQ